MRRTEDMSDEDFESYVTLQKKKLHVVESRVGELLKLYRRMRKAVHRDEKLEAHLDTHIKKILVIESMTEDLRRMLPTGLKWFRQVQTNTMPSSSTPNPNAPAAPAAPPLKGLARYNAERAAKVAARKQGTAKSKSGAPAR